MAASWYLDFYAGSMYGVLLKKILSALTRAKVYSSGENRNRRGPLGRRHHSTQGSQYLYTNRLVFKMGLTQRTADYGKRSVSKQLPE